MSIAWAQPAVRAWAQPFLDAQPLGDDANCSMSITRRGDGWRIAVEFEAHSLEVLVLPDGTGTITADGTSTPIDASLVPD